MDKNIIEPLSKFLMYQGYENKIFLDVNGAFESLSIPLDDDLMNRYGTIDVRPTESLPGISLFQFFIPFPFIVQVPTVEGLLSAVNFLSEKCPIGHCGINTENELVYLRYVLIDNEGSLDETKWAEVVRIMGILTQWFSLPLEELIKGKIDYVTFKDKVVKAMNGS